MRNAQRVIQFEDFLIFLPGVLFKRNESLVLCLGLGPLGDSDQKVLRLQAYQGEQEKRRNKKCKDLCVHKFPPGCISMPDSCSYLITNISPAHFLTSLLEFSALGIDGRW